MLVKYQTVMFLWLFFLGNVISSPAGHDYRTLVNEGELTSNDEPYLKHIVPGCYSSQKSPKQVGSVSVDIFDKQNEHYKILSQHIEAGHVMKGLTFTIYDDNMREATIALFRLLQTVDEKNLNALKEWAYKHINKDLLDYALRLAIIQRDDEVIEDLPPPFVTQPNYFVSSDTIYKALKLKANNGKLEGGDQEKQIHQIFRLRDFLIINTNYSGWNQWNEDCIDYLDYFRQDISLNSFYYGLQLLYPFWMSNDELSAVDSKHAERYYYVHKLLLARYNLEKEHLIQRNISIDSKCFDDFTPYLSYDNGLPFSKRSTVNNGMEWSKEYTRIKSINIAIKEFITRGVIFTENATKVELTEDNYVDLLTKLIRNHFDSIQTGKSVRDLLVYGGNGYPPDRYNPAPSVLHHPQTVLRDPIYWYMIQNMLKYFTEYASTLEPCDFSKYQTEDIEIIGNNFSRIATYYDDYLISLNNIFDNYAIENIETTEFIYTARQKRLKHLPINLHFTYSSKVNRTSIVKLFLGPKCPIGNCWDILSQFYEIDTFTSKLKEGVHVLKWSAERSAKYSRDDYFNMEVRAYARNMFHLLKFPENLIIPKGLREGLNLTLFIIILPEYYNSDTAYHEERIGFPFHREVIINNTNYNNYKFYNISVYHKSNTRKVEGYYSTHLN